MHIDYLIVGAGFAGCTAAERLANQIGKKVLLVEKRSHIGGNAYDFKNKQGIWAQKYGPHIFHTQSERVWQYLNQFIAFNNYVHRVIAEVKGMEVYLPINLELMEKIFQRSFTAEEMEQFLKARQIKTEVIKNSQDVALSAVGEELYDLFFKNYSKKQWGVYPDQLAAEVLARLPVRYNRDTRYFTDPFQGIPINGYTELFKKMINHPRIHLLLNTDYKDVLTSVSYDRMIYTGPLDEYFYHCYGKLPYRCMEFRFKTMPYPVHQNAAVVNYPNDYDYTRVSEFKHFYLQNHAKTTICYEYPNDQGDPCYPVPLAVQSEMFLQYQKRRKAEKNTWFVGRLAEYQYLNMDQAVLHALELVDRLES